MDTTATSTFGTLLRRCRVAAGLTQEELAERATISLRNLGNLERGVGLRPRKDTVALLCAALALDARKRNLLTVAAARTGVPLSHSPEGREAGAGATPTFVGRVSELALLERFLSGGGPPVLLLAGEPGIGKTRLLRAAIPRAVAQGMQVLEGGCQRRGGQQPFAPLLGALQQYVRGRPPARLRRDLQGCAWLVRLMPELAGGPIPPLPAWQLSPEQERRLMHEAVAGFLTNVAGPGGTLLVLDDLQWASPDALALLDTLLLVAPDVPLRILGAYRDTELDAESLLHDLFADLAHAGLVARRRLHPLASDEAARLLDNLPLPDIEDRPALRDLLLQRTGGVPFFLVSFARALQEGDRGDDVPWDVGMSVRQRVAALPEEVQELLRLASIAGRSVPRSWLTTLSSQAEGAVATALDSLCAAGLLEDIAGDTYQFSHDVIREVVEAGLGTARRKYLHGRLAEMLERQSDGDSVELLAYHYGRSSSEEKAIRYLELAGARARSGYAYVAAEAYYRELIERLDRSGRVRDGALARAQLGEILHLTARYAEALSVLEHSVTLLQSTDDLEGFAASLAQLGRAHAALGMAEQGLNRIRPLLSAAAVGRPSHGLAALYAALAWLYMGHRRYGECVAAAERAGELARAVGDDQILLDAEVRRGSALGGIGRWVEGQRVLEGTLSLAESQGDLHCLFRALHILADMLVESGEFARARACSERSLEVAERSGEQLGILFALAALSRVLVLQSMWSLAQRRLEQASALSNSVGWTLVSPLIHVRLAEFELARENPASAAAYLEDPRVACLPHGQRLLARCDLLEGRPHAALERLIALLATHSPTDRGTDLLSLLARAYRDLGRGAEAVAVARQAIEQARAVDSRLTLVHALHELATISIDARQWDAAAESLEEGLSLARTMPYPHTESVLQHLYKHVGDARYGRVTLPESAGPDSTPLEGPVASSDFLLTDSGEQATL